MTAIPVPSLSPVSHTSLGPPVRQPLLRHIWPEDNGTAGDAIMVSRGVISERHVQSEGGQVRGQVRRNFQVDVISIPSPPSPGSFARVWNYVTKADHRLCSIIF